MWANTVGYPDLKRIAVEAFRAPSARDLEQASNGIALIDDLRATTALPQFPGCAGIVKGCPRRSGYIPSRKRRDRFPRSAPWLEECIDENCRFPVGKHDDMVDALVWALLVAQQNINRAIGDQLYRDQISNLGDWMGR